MKKGLRITGIILAVLLLGLLVGVVAIQSPRVQTYLAHKAIEQFKDKIDGDLRVGKISVRPMDAVYLEDVALIDVAPYSDSTYAPLDTLFSASSIAVKFSLAGLLDKRGFHISHAEIKDLSFALVMEPGRDGRKSSTNLQRIFRAKPADPNREKKPWGHILDADRVEVDNLHYRMVNYPATWRREENGRRELPPTVTDWNDCSIRGNLSGRKLKIADGLIICNVEKLNLREKSGLNFTHLSGKVRVGKGRVDIRDLRIVDPLSDLHFKYFRMVAPIKDYSHFLEKVRLEADILKPSVISMKTISHFAPNISHFTFRPEISGKYEGYVSDFCVKDFRFRDTDSGVSGTINGGMIGLPTIGSTLFDYRVKDFCFTSAGLTRFIQGWAPRVKSGLQKMAPGEVLCFNGTAKGPLNRLLAKGTIDSRLGRATADITLRNVLDRQRPIIIGGALTADDLDAGKIAGIDQIHEVTLRTGLEATLAKEGIQVRLDSLHVDRLNAMGYDYTGISAVGNYSDKAFDGRLVCNDPNLNFLFQGLFNLSPRTRDAAYQFYANLGYADLHALHLDKRERSKLAFQTSANFIRTQDKDLLGAIEVLDLMLESDTGAHNLGDVKITAQDREDTHQIRLRSSFVEGTYVGDKSVFSLISDLKDLVIRKELSALLPEGKSQWDGSAYDADITFHDTRELLNFLAPGAYIEKNSSVRLKISKEGMLNAAVTSGRLAYQGKFLKDLSLKLNNADEALRAQLNASLMHLGALELKGNNVSLFAEDNHIGLGYSFDNETEAANRGELYLSGDLSRPNNKLALQAEILPSNIYYDGEGWGLKCSRASLSDGTFSVQDLKAQSNDQLIDISGAYSPRKKDTLTLKLEKFDISLLNSLTGGKPEIRGRASGRAVVISPASPMPGILAALVCDSTYVAGRRAGTLKARSVWNEEKKHFAFRLFNDLDAHMNMDITGSLAPSTRELAAKAELDGFDLGYISPFLESIFDRFEASLDGTVRVNGKLDKLHFQSENTRIRDGLLQVEFTQVPYQVAGPVEINDGGLFFQDVSISDGDAGKGSVNGGIRMKNLKDFRMDTHLTFDQMKVLAIRSEKDSPIYGDVYGGGKVDITGPFNQLQLDIDATTQRSGNLHIPLGSGSSARIKNILTFKEPSQQMEVDQYELLVADSPKKTRRGGNLGLKLKVRATPDVTAYIDIGGNSLSGVGNGLIEIESKLSEGGLTMGGDYTLSEGNFHFSALSLVNRDFAIQNGSSVRFNGPVMDTDLDVNGLYTTKTSLSNLLADSTSVSRRTVNCGIHITDKLRNPQIAFSIDIPDLDPATQSEVESALNTEDKIQKQFLYLLITNSFLPVEESGITTGGSNMLYSNVTSIMAGQLNNIFQKLDIPLDLGLNYEPSTSGGRDLFDVALSTQLFNNRVLVNGTIGSRRYGATTTNEVSGDLDIEVKLNKPGTFRLNIFSHSADQYSSFLDYSQRNGIGIAYQREFAKPPSSQLTLQIDSTGKAVPLKDDALR